MAEYQFKVGDYVRRKKIMHDNLWKDRVHLCKVPIDVCLKVKEVSVGGKRVVFEGIMSEKPHNGPQWQSDYFELVDTPPPPQTFEEALMEIERLNKYISDNEI